MGLKNGLGKFTPGCVKFTGGAGGIPPTVYYNFLSGALDPTLTYSRASSATYFDANGILQTVGNNVPRFDHSQTTLAAKGLNIEQASTNQALHCRDFTQASWVAVTMTAALNQTGIDGTANSASLLTASAGNATILQTLTQAAAASQFSLYLKRISGTGVINVTQNAGVTWTPVTLTANWQRFNAVNASTLNPSFGIQIVTNGDSIAADYSQFEPLSYASSPILTTTASATRAVDICYNGNLTWFNAAHGSFVASVIMPGVSAADTVMGPNLINDSDGQFNKKYTAFLTAAPATQPSAQNGGTFVNFGVTAYTLNNTVVWGEAYTAGSCFASVGGANSASTPQTINPLPAGIDTLVFFAEGKTGATQSGWIQQFAYWNYQLSQTQLNSQTLFF